MNKGELLSEEIQHVNIRSFNATKIIDQYSQMSFQARNLARAARITAQMVKDPGCTIILSIAGSLVSAGLKRVIVDMVECRMVDAIVSSGANIVDQDFFEGLGYKHYKGDPKASDSTLLKKRIDRIYDTYVNDEELRVCADTVGRIADDLPPEPLSSREFIREMGRYLKSRKLGKDSIVRTCFERNVPIFVPAFSDCSAGIGLLMHQHKMKNAAKLTIDSAKDLLEFTKIKMSSKSTGLCMVGGGVPKSFAQGVAAAAERIGKGAGMHKYAVQITVADERDGGLSGSSLREAHSWGRVETAAEQMVFCEATLAFPLLASYVYHQGGWKKRRERKFSAILDGGKI